MDDMNPEEKEVWMRQRIQQLRNQLDEISGGEVRFGGSEEGVIPLEAELQFLEQVVGFETAAETTWRIKLREAGYEIPPPETLTDEEVSLEVWQLIQRLSELHAYLDFTNHLSDRELYEKLCEHVDHSVADVFLGEGTAFHFEMLASGVEEDDEIWLRYFADEETRQHWKNEFDVKLPPKETPPYDRDRFLPQREIPESPALIFARRLAETAWDPKQSPMRLNSDLHPVDLEKIVALQLARTLLEVLATRGKAIATAKRDLLPRAVVKEVFQTQPFPPERIQRNHELFKQFDEEDYSRIHFVRAACQQAGLLRKYAGAFQITKKGAKLLNKDRSAELYLELFQSGFSKVNLAAFDGAPDLPSLQYSLPVVLLRLWEEDKNWLDMEEVAAEVLLPEPYFELMEAETYPGSADHTLWVRLLRWIDDFGLLECLVPETPRYYVPKAMRVSEFGRHLLDFDLPDPQ